MIQDVDAAQMSVLETRLNELEAEVKTLRTNLEAQKLDNQLSIICFSGEYDRLFATLSIAAGGLAMGMDVHMFFTFWGLGALRSAENMDTNGKSTTQSLFNHILPSGPENAPLSRFNYGGLGKFMMRRVMTDKGIEDLDTLLEEVIELGGHFHLCDTTTEMFGLECKELRVGDQVNHCGVATFLSYAMKSRMVLFI